MLLQMGLLTRFTITFSFIFLSLFSYQLESKNLDSLLKQLSLKEDLWKVDTLLELYSDVLKEAIQKNDSSSIGESYCKIAEQLKKKNELSGAIFNVKKALVIFERLNDTIKMGECYLLLGYFVNLKEQTTEAINYYYKALPIFHEQTNSINLAKTLKGIASVNFQLKRFEEAKNYHYSALKIFESNNYSSGIASSLMDLGNCYLELKNNSLAFDKLQQALVILKTCKRDDLVSICLIRISICYFHEKKPRKSLACLHEAAAIVESLVDKKNLPIIYNNIGHIYLKQNQFDSSLMYLNNAYLLASPNGNNRKLAIINASLSEYYEAIGNHKKALTFFKQATYFNDSVNLKDANSKLIMNEMNFNIQNKELLAKNEGIKKEMAYSKKLNSQRFFYSSLVIFLIIILVGVSFFLIRRNYQIKIESKSQLVLLQEDRLNNVLEIQENERRLIAQEIHDTAGALIVSIKYAISNCLSVSENSDIGEKLKKTSNLADRLANHLRSISHRMLPVTLIDLGLIIALEELLSMLLTPNEITYDFKHHIDQLKLNPQIELCLYRIMEELLSNIIKHAQAKKIVVTLYNSDNLVVLIVEDNGIGISESKKEGLGFRSIASRLKPFDGNYSFENNAELGSVSIVKLII